MLDNEKVRVQVCKYVCIFSPILWLLFATAASTTVHHSAQTGTEDWR